LSLFLNLIYRFFLSYFLATTVVNDYSDKGYYECNEAGCDRYCDPILSLIIIVIADEADYKSSDKHKNGLCKVYVFGALSKI
jgi:hypothetical protein